MKTTTTCLFTPVLLTLAFFISFSQLSAQPLCNAEFTYHHSTHNADSVGFLQVHTNYLHYSWSFGDGSHSTNVDPWHYYTSPGTYYVCLTVTDSTAAGTCTDTWCDSITIGPHTGPLCNAEFTYHHSTHNADSVGFLPVHTNYLHYSWSFGDGSHSTNVDPWHYYTSPGTYYVCLTVTDSNATGTCTDTWCDSITIGHHTGPLCNAEFTYHHSTHNVDSVGFLPVHTNYLYYYWSFGDGSHSTNVDPWHYYTSPGTYYVCLTVTDSTATGTCTDTWCDSITIGHHTGPLCNAEFTYHHSTHNVDSVGFLPVHTNYLHYYWSFGDGSHSTNVDPWHYYTSPGTYYVCLTVTDSTATGTCTDTWCDSITIGHHTGPLCNAEFTYHHSTHNADSLSFVPVHTNYLHYSWSFGDGSYSTNVDPWHYFAPGTYYVCLTVTDSNAMGTCMDTWCDSITIGHHTGPLCNAEFTYHHSTHNADSLSFVPVHTNYLHYSWSFGDGSHSTHVDPWHYYAPGSYYVCLTVTDSNATGTCSDTWCDSVIIGTPQTPICNAEFTFSSVTNPVSYHFNPVHNNYQTYLWDFGDGIQSTNHDPWHTYTNLGNYIVCLTVTDSNSIGTCTDTWCDTVSVLHHFVNNVNLFANPASNIITVNIQNIIPPAVFMISDLQGREVYLNTEAVNGPLVIGLNGNASGIYYYRLIDADSNKYSGKVIMIHN